MTSLGTTLLQIRTRQPRRSSVSSKRWARGQRSPLRTRSSRSIGVDLAGVPAWCRPYCDFVATGREATHALHADGVPTRLQTTVAATLDEIVEALV
jgi:hypothetical protein